MKPKVGFYWCAACGGCEECILDLAEGLLPVLDAIEIVFWPVALDRKEHDLEEMEDQAIDIAFVNGAIRTTEQSEVAALLRAKSKTVVAFGACAKAGGIPGLANLASAKEIVDVVYEGTDVPSEQYRVDGHLLKLPHLYDAVLPLDRVIAVDYYVPGCPPTPNIISAAFQALMSPDRPPRGSVLAPDHALCEQCPRKSTRPENLLLSELRRVDRFVLDPEKCILAQGVICLGPSTRAGCEARCISGNMPCTGCFGPTDRVRDFGAKALSAVASVIEGTEEEKIAPVLDTICDPAGTFYRFNLAASYLNHINGERSL